MRYFHLTGTASRAQAWRVALVTLLVLVTYFALRYWGAPILLVNLAAALAMLFGAAQLATLVRRLHDIGRPGYWVLLCLLPWLGGIVALVILCWPASPHKYTARAAWPRRLGAVGLAALVLVALLRAVWFPVWAPSSSMQPTLLAGDYIAARPVSASGVSRGDLLIYRHPVTERDHIGRLIGLPGDTVQVAGGQILLNGQPVPQQPTGDFIQTKEQQGPALSIPRCGNDPVPQGGDCITAQLTETLPDGRSYAVLDLMAGSPGDDMAPVTIPDDHYFLMGDNRDNALDSRFAPVTGGPGLMAGSDLIAQIDRVVFSAAGPSFGFFWTWRADRFMLRPL